MSAVCYPWTQVAAEDGSFYFWNLITNETTWDHPQNQTTKSQNVPTQKGNVPKPPMPNTPSSSSLKSNPGTTSKSSSFFTVNKPVSTPAKPPPPNNNNVNTPPKPPSSSSNPVPIVNTRLRRSRSFTENTSSSWKLAPPKSVEPIEVSVSPPSTTPPKSQAPPRPTGNRPPAKTFTSSSSAPPIPQRPVAAPPKPSAVPTPAPPKPSPPTSTPAPAPTRTQPPTTQRPPLAVRKPPPSSAPRPILDRTKSAKEFTPNKNLKNFGGHESISMPTEFVHVGNINSDTLLALAQDGTEKRGFLAKQSGLSWKDRWIVVSKGKLKIFKHHTDTIPRKMYELRESTVELEKAVSRKYAIHVFITAEKKKHLVLAAAHDEDYAQWMAAFKVNGSADLDYIKTNQVEDEKKKKEESKLKERQMAKAEDEYVKSGKKVDVQEWKQKQQQAIENTDQTNCVCEFQMVGVKYLTETKFQHKIQVTYADQQWCIYRFEKQFTEALNMIRTLVSIKIKKPKMKYDAKTNATFIQQFLTALAAERILLNSKPKAAVVFSRLIAPIQYGDEKADDFVMPFKIDM